MGFAHERLEVYQLAIEFIAWSQLLAQTLPASASTRSQLERAATSIPLNIAEGNAKSSKRDRGRFWQIALGSTLECAAVLDVLVASGLKSGKDVEESKEALERIAAMLFALLSRLGRRVADCS